MTGMDEPDPSFAREMIEIVGQLALTAVVIVALALAPIPVMLLLNKWAGVPVAIGAFWVWSRVGPPPMPGLANGALCLGGYAAILGSLIACIALALL